MILDHAGIAALLPHRDAMCLLDSVDRVDATSIDCRSRSHRRKPHPMADADGRLGAACGIEYGAQAMALHAALSRIETAPEARLAQGTPGADNPAEGKPPQRMPMGMLAGVRALRLDCDRLDDIDDELRITATLLSGDPRTAIYDLAVSASGRILLQGRATVIIDATPPPEPRP